MPEPALLQYLAIIAAASRPALAARSHTFTQTMAMSFTSYARNFEDVMLWRILGPVTSGCYIDVGADELEDHAVSQAFHERGWKGIHVTPHPAVLAALEGRRHDLRILAAVGQSRPLARHASTALAAGPDTSDDAAAGQDGIPLLTLDAVFAQAGVDTIHWMRVRVDDSGNHPFADWTGAQPRPWVVLVHAPAATAAVRALWEAPLSKKGYRFAGNDGGNHFYLLADAASASRLPQPLPWLSAASEAAANAAADHAQQLRTLQAGLSQSQEAAQEALRRCAEAEERARLAEGRAGRLELEVVAALTEAQQVRELQQRLQDVYASTSWQVTGPMRWLSRMRHSPRSASAELVVRGRRAGAGLLRRLIRLALANPTLRRLALRIALRHPELVARFKARLQTGSAPLPPPQAAMSVAPSSHTTVLGPRFKTLILDELARSSDPAHEGKH